MISYHVCDVVLSCDSQAANPRFIVSMVVADVTIY